MAARASAAQWGAVGVHYVWPKHTGVGTKWKIYMETCMFLCFHV